LVSGSLDGALKHWDLRLLLGNSHKGTFDEVGAEEAGSAEESGQNEGVCVCAVEYIGHTVCCCPQSSCFLCLVSGLLNLYYSQVVILMNVDMELSALHFCVI
jgi:hypothetical protein